MGLSAARMLGRARTGGDEHRKEVNTADASSHANALIPPRDGGIGRRAAAFAIAMATVCAACLPMAVAAGASAGATPAKAASAGVAAVGGVGPAEWTVRWWRWAHSFDDGQRPYQDPDGGRCALGQDEDGPVWFLAGTDGRSEVRRRCQVPVGKHLLVPVINMYFHAPRIGEYAHDCDQVKAQVTVNNDALVSAVAVLDGKALPRPARLTSRCFDPFAQGDKEDRRHRGPYHAAADGYWLLLPPLAPGKHRLVIGANYGNGEDADFGRMIQNFEYELQIGEPTI